MTGLATTSPSIGPERSISRRTGSLAASSAYRKARSLKRFGSAIGMPSLFACSAGVSDEASWANSRPHGKPCCVTPEPARARPLLGLPVADRRSRPTRTMAEERESERQGEPVR